MQPIPLLGPNGPAQGQGQERVLEAERARKREQLEREREGWRGSGKNWSGSEREKDDPAHEVLVGLINERHTMGERERAREGMVGEGTMGKGA